jgi:DNA-directed RNA polymerase specialized sigma24 family protein
MHRFAEPVNEGRMSLTGEEAIERERRLWRALAMKISAREAGLEDAFQARYATGVRAMLRRALGPAGLDSLVKETLAGAMDEIRRGVLREPRHFVHFVRSVVDRQLREKAAVSERPAGRYSYVDRMRLRETQLSVERALGEFTPLERAILTSYYTEGITRHEVERRFGVGGELLDLLRARMQELVRPRRADATCVERRAPLARGAAAGSE